MQKDYTYRFYGHLAPQLIWKGAVGRVTMAARKEPHGLPMTLANIRALASSPLAPPHWHIHV
jgi:hypothetical protein